MPLGTTSKIAVAIYFPLISCFIEGDSIIGNRCCKSGFLTQFGKRRFATPEV